MRVGDDLRIGTRLLVGATQVLCSSPLRRFAALSDMAPIVKGHAVVMPLSGAQLSSTLDDESWLDLWRTAMLAAQAAELGVGANACNLLLREGSHAAWKDASAHLHVVPRVPGDFARNDDVFSAMEAWVPPGSEETNGPPAWVLPDDADRKDRTTEMMADEASVYRGYASGGVSVEATDRAFGKFTIPHEHVFYDSASQRTQAFVNLRPLAPGHVLVTPRRVVPRLVELSIEERDDLFLAVRAVVELGIQDGRQAGQSVPHVHVHVIPR